MRSRHMRQYILLLIVLPSSAWAASASADPVILSCYIQGKLFGSASIDIENELVTFGIGFKYRIIKIDEATIHAIETVSARESEPEHLIIDRSTGAIKRIIPRPIGEPGTTSAISLRKGYSELLSIA